ncbi:T9SS type A sorting domain-containing protein [Rufibacter psychrotolerans]|uniref:T9SS type A sorting domain-containing protein n=1 Tax=Rufibacter psychrotolerans TaxID=2812556 RepID=UPI0019687C42|nr:T9SS type A sorting domain-containing protein [Rufibacter sp. SYSU D00308]
MGAQGAGPYTAGDYRTVTAGTLGQNGGTSTLEQLTSQGTWLPATYPLPTTATVYVEHAVQLSGPLQLARLQVASSKALTVPAGSRLLVTDRVTVAPSAELIQEGEVESRGVLQLQTNARLIIKSAQYQAASPLWAGLEQIDASAEVRVEAAAANALLFSGAHLTAQPHGYWFGRLTLALPGSTSQWKLTDVSAPLAAQAFRSTLPASSSLLFLSGASLSLSFGADVALSGGTYFVQSQNAGTGVLSVAGNMSLQGSVLTLNQLSSSTAVSNIDLKGNLQTDGASTINNSSTVKTDLSGIRLVGTSWQLLQAAGPINHVSLMVKSGALVRLGQHVLLNPSNSVYAGTLQVENGATLDFGADANGLGYQVQGQGYFKLDQGGTLYITSAQGINATGNSGNVVVTDSRRTFNQVATFVYNSLLPQQTGNALTATTSGKIMIMDNPTTLALTQSTGISSSGGRLEIRQGTFIASPSADINGAGRLVMTGGTYKIAANTTVPQLTGTYELTGGAIELAGNGEQTLRGKTYHKIIVGGTNTPGVNAKTISTTTTINQNLTILPNAILDLNNKSLKGTGGLTMTGGLFRTSRISGTWPELEGKSEPYQITGGTIEFYGSVNTQNQSIRGTYGNSQNITYHNVLLTAAEANTDNDLGNQLVSANFDVAGTLTVKAPSVLQIATNRAIGGTGNFILEPGATLLYGSPQGIKLSGTGTLDGNVRVSGTRSFSPQASYGFIGNSEMVTGDGLPATVANLLVAKTAGGVTLSKSVKVTNVLTLRSGVFKTDLHEVSLLSPAATALQVVDPNLWVQGNLRRAVGNSGTYTFPVGHATGKRQMDLMSLGLSGNGFQSILVSFKPLQHHQDGDLFLTEGGHTYTHMGTEGVWQVEPNAVPSEGNFTALAYLQGFNNLSDNKFALLIRPLTSTSGKDWTTGGGTLDAPDKDGRTLASGYAKRNFIKPFGQIGIATMETVLPVSWLYVKGQRKNQAVLVEWATATEINNDRFEVEYSQDGRNFSLVGVVKGGGHSSTVQKYQFQHGQASSATTYYRVKQLDYDGKFEYSKTIAVKEGNRTEAHVRLYPNPSAETVYLANITLEPTAVVEILDLKGQRVEKVQPVSTGQNPAIPVKHLPAGNYILKIQNSDRLIQQRFIKL